MSFDITGKLIKKYDTEQKSERFSVRDFVIEVVDGQYPQFIKFQCTNDRTNIIDDYNEGDMVKVHFDLRGREWQGKYFTNLNAWRTEKPATAPNAQGGNDTPVFNDGPFADGSFPSAADAPPANNNAAQNVDDLPF